MDPEDAKYAKTIKTLREAVRALPCPISAISDRLRPASRNGDCVEIEPVGTRRPKPLKFPSTFSQEYAERERRAAMQEKNATQGRPPNFPNFPSALKEIRTIHKH